MALRTAAAPALGAVPGLVHGFEQRAPREGPETHEQSLSRVAEALEGAGRLLLLKQVHGASVVEAPWEGTPEADASVASGAGWLLGIKTADCLPVLLVDPERRLVAAAHAGWRGTAAGVAARAVEALVRRGSRPEDLLAALGPGIGPCCYEVSTDLADRFEAAFGAGVVDRSRPAPRLDLWESNARALVAAGLLPARIDRLERCTACERPLFFSHRRDGGATGRQVAWIAPGAASGAISGAR